MPDYILAADVGGTKADVGLFELGGGKALKPVRTATLPTSSYGSLSGLFDTFLLMDFAHVRAACIGVAGQVRDGKALAPNLPWPVHVDRLVNSLGIEQIELINDLVATALGIPAVEKTSLVVLQEGKPESGGTRALVAPGTGLGEAIMAFDGCDYRPLASEGGHADFAPADELQAELLEYMRPKVGGHVSVERLASGQGLGHIFDFLVETGRYPQSSNVCDMMATMDKAAVVSGEGGAGRDDACARALDLYTAILGAEAGNLALKSLSTGGLYLGGGIPPKILPRLKTDLFLNAFRSKGRMTELMDQIPVTVICEPKTALHGAARRATAMLGNGG